MANWLKAIAFVILVYSIIFSGMAVPWLGTAYILVFLAALLLIPAKFLLDYWDLFK